MDNNDSSGSEFFRSMLTFDSSPGVGLSESSENSPTFYYAGSPTLKIVEQPARTAPFQFSSEVQKDKNICVKGINNNEDNNNLTRPTAKLIRNGYDGDVLLTCTPVCQMIDSSTVNDNLEEKENTIHPYRLIDQKERKSSRSSKLTLDLVDPIKFELKSGDNSLFVVDCMIMIPGTRSNLKREKSPPNKKNFDVNMLFLKFDAFKYENGRKGDSICESIFSDPILNSNVQQNSTPKISRSDSSLTMNILSPPTSLSSVSSDEYDQVQPMNSTSPSRDSACRLVLEEQPEETTYFRNESEINEDKHGHIKGRSGKKYPSVKLVGYNKRKDVLITVTPYVIKNDDNNLYIHPYRLVMQDRKLLSDEVMDPYTCVAKANKKYKVEIKATIMIPDRKKSKFLRDGLPITTEIRKNYDLQKAYLCFEAFEMEYGPNNEIIKGKQIAEREFSDIIGNQRSHTTNKLEIKELKINEGSAEGGDIAWVRCTPISRNTIAVRFSRGDTFECYAQILDVDKHLVIFRIPAFEDINIKTPVTVDIEVERDGTFSNSLEFKYMPKQKKSLKRTGKTLDSSSSSSDSDGKSLLEEHRDIKMRKTTRTRNTELIVNSPADSRSDSSHVNSAIQCEKVDSQNNSNKCGKLKTNNVSNEDMELEKLFEFALEYTAEQQTLEQSKIGSCNQSNFNGSPIQDKQQTSKESRNYNIILSYPDPNSNNVSIQNENQTFQNNSTYLLGNPPNGNESFDNQINIPNYYNSDSSKVNFAIQCEKVDSQNNNIKYGKFESNNVSNEDMQLEKRIGVVLEDTAKWQTPDQSMVSLNTLPNYNGFSNQSKEQISEESRNCKITSYTDPNLNMVSNQNEDQTIEELRNNAYVEPNSNTSSIPNNLSYLCETPTNGGNVSFNNQMDFTTNDFTSYMDQDGLALWNSNDNDSTLTTDGVMDLGTYFLSEGPIERYSQHLNIFSVIKIFFFAIIQVIVQSLLSCLESFKSNIFYLFCYTEEDIKFYNDEAPEVNINDIIEEDTNKIIIAVNNENFHKRTSYLRSNLRKT